jgi:ketosteroid isomerase-like protein
MDATAMLKEFCDAVEKRDGKRFATLFAEDGVYHDVFYGAFAGRAKIAELIDDWFHRTARDFRWDMHDPLCDGRALYAYYTFSYVSTLPEAQGRRVGFEGVAMMKLRDGLIAEYREVANVGPAFVALGFAPERVSKILAKEGAALQKEPRMKRHVV